MIYLDYNATSPILPEVREAMLPLAGPEWGNPSSAHRFGAGIRRYLQKAREQVATLVHALPDEIVFTSGATEANNAALHSAILAAPGRKQIVTSAAEHSSVITYCRFLEQFHGFKVEYLGIDSRGLPSVEDFARAISKETAVVALMWGNNETGVLNPVQEIAALCQERGVAFLCDAVQAFGKVSMDFTEIGADFLSLSGHKIGAPKGVGALVIKDKSRFIPFIHGGKQEDGCRGGTEGVASIIGLGRAAEIALARADWTDVERLRDGLESALLKAIPGSKIHGANAKRLPNTTNVHFPGIDSDAAVIFLDQKGICVSSGSACMESAIAPSHVILAMARSHEVASESLRISLGWETTEADIFALVEQLKQFAALQV